MEIEFQLNEEDYIDYNVNHAKKSPSLKRSVTIIRILGPVAFLIAPFLIVNFSDIPFWYWMSIFGITSVVWIVFYPKYFNWELKRKIAKMLLEGKNDSLFKQIKISLNETGIVQQSRAGETMTEWNEVDSVDETHKHIYIYNSSISAYIIPKRAFNDQQAIDLFLEKIHEHYKILKPSRSNL